MTDTALKLLKAGCDVNSRDSDGMTPLFYWSQCSESEAPNFLQILLDNGADATAEDKYGNTSLHFLNINHAVSPLQILVTAGANMNKARFVDGKTPLMCALNHWASSKPPDWHEYAHKYGVDPNAQDSDGLSILHRVVAQDSWDIEKIEAWLQAGADPNLQDGHGRSCFFTLSRSNNTAKKEAELLNTLRVAGLDINTVDHQGRNVALNLCSKESPSYILDYLKRLKDYGVDLTAQEYDGKTALHLVAGQEVSHHSTSEGDYKRTLQTLQFLVDEGVSPNSQDFSGRTMLHYWFSSPTRFATSSSFSLKLALAIGVDPSVQDYMGRTVLHIASAIPLADQSGYSGCDGEKRLDLLLDPPLNLDVNLADRQGRTPLHFAATRCAARVSRLLSAGSNIRATDHQKRNILHFAARAGNANVLGFVGEVLKHRQMTGLLDGKDCNGRTALHDAVRSGVLESVQMLLEFSANPNLADNRGKTALHIASEVVEERQMQQLQHSTAHGFSRPTNHFGADLVLPGYVDHPGGLQYEDSLRPLRNRDAKPEDNEYVPDGCMQASAVGQIVRSLLQAGADPVKVDSDGKTALEVAIANGCKEVFFALIFEGHDPRPVDKSMYTTLLTRNKPGQASNGQEHSLAELKRRRWMLEQKISYKAVEGYVANPEEATSLLFPAITNGDEDLVLALLGLGADPLHTTKEGLTVLHLAVRGGLTTIVKHLAAGLRDKQELPKNLLHEAARRQEPNLGMIKLLIELGMDLNAQEKTKADDRDYWEDDYDESVAHVLARSKYWWQPRTLEYLLDIGMDTELKTSNGKTALQIAIRGRLKNHDEPGFWRNDAIATLLKHDARINFTDSKGETPLIQAFTEGADIVDTLLAHGADITFGPSSPISYAVSSFNVDVVGSLLKAGAALAHGPDITFGPFSLISYAVSSFNVDVVRSLLKAGADPNAVCSGDRRQKEPLLLHIACASLNSSVGFRDSIEGRRQRAEQIVELLIHAGADINVILDDGTPMINPIVRESGILEPFLRHGVNLEVRDVKGKTPFLVACEVRRPEEILYKMIEAGADAKAVDNSGKNALHWAAISANTYYNDTFKEATVPLASGVAVNDRDNAQMTPLHYAVTRQCPGAINRLLDAGADASIELPDKTTTILHILLPRTAEGGQRFESRQAFIPSVQRFIDAGIDKEARDGNGNTPIFGYVAKQPQYDDEYFEMNSYPDLEEQRQVLLNYNIHARNNAGESLLHVAAKRSRHVEGLPQGRDDTRDMFKLLWDLGLDPKTEDGAQRTPLDVAAACGNTGILDLFAPKMENESAHSENEKSN